MAHSAHPANLYTRISHDQCISLYTLCYNRAGSNKGIFTNIMAADYGCICADGSPPANPGMSILMPSVYGTSWINNISKDTGGA
ncbi:hypothetical protein SDC9_162537 [bioreactor metagenome]|uniref:Uncharacterized protein n=1 Tax=bioreactor metagenome TaxID=1076179 RepID=A0A645FLB9_9ZZZZ